MLVEELLEKLAAHPEIKTKAEIARLCGVSKQALQFWRRIPAEYCRRLERACDGTVTRYQMRPDVFGTGPEDDGSTSVA